MSNGGALDAAARGEHRAGQVCPFFGIQCETLRIHLVVIDKQDSFVGNNIIFGSPGGQCPVCVSSLGSDAAGQETIDAGIYSLQGSRGQQSIAAVQLHLYAFFKCNVLQLNEYGILRNTGPVDAATIGDSAGQGCPFFGIQFESHRILLLVIDKQDSFIGNNIVLGDPRGQAPGFIIFTHGRYTTGHELLKLVCFHEAFIQSGSGQQSFVAEQLHLYAFFKCNVLQLNEYGILRNTGPVDAAVAFCRCDSGQGADHDQNQHHCK